jgi:hypothetical protein
MDRNSNFNLNLNMNDKNLNSLNNLNNLQNLNNFSNINLKSSDPNSFLNDLIKYTGKDKEDSKSTKNYDGGLINIIKSYHDYENEKKRDKEPNSNSNSEANLNEEIEKDSFLEESQDSVLFSNCFIQNSFNRFNILKKIIMRKQNMILIYHLDKWLINSSKINFKLKSEMPSSSNTSILNSYHNTGTETGMIVENSGKDYLSKNREIIEAYCEESMTSYSDYDYLNIQTTNSNISHEKNNLSNFNNFGYKSDKSDKSDRSDPDFPLQTPKETELSLQSIKINKSNIPISFIEKNKNNLCLVIKNILMNKLKNYLTTIYGKFPLYINSKKLANSSLSLLYIFTELAISKNKLSKSQKSNFKNNENKTSPSYITEDLSLSHQNLQLKQKLEESDKKISKYETNLNEKAMIIESRNDRIEGLLETNEALQEEIRKLSHKVDRLERKTKNLNIVEESLCKNCGNSLEESFIQLPKESPKKENFNNSNNSHILDLKKIIQEQLDYILKMESESKEIRIKNEEYKYRNEMIIGELDIIKSEFKSLSEGLNKKASQSQSINNSNFDLNNTVSILKINLTDASTQTQAYLNENSSNSSKIISSNSKNNFSQISHKSSSNMSNLSSSALKKSSKKFSNKLNLKNSGENNHSSNSTNLANPILTNNNSSNITNYNIININSSSSKISQNSNSNLNSNSNTNFSSHNETEKEILQSLRFDNSLLTQEIISLNKELTKNKNEMKNFVDNLKKIEKEKNDLNNKFKTKNENFDKLKKENEELMILINTSNYKSFISVEGENKKLKFENLNLLKELENLKSDLTSKEKKLQELETDFVNVKKSCDNLIKFKSEREDLVLENAKLDSELKQSRYEAESTKNLIERQNIILKKQDETISKLNEDMNYFNFNANKSKKEADRAMQDSLTYQQIVRKLEKDFSEVNLKKEKLENELMIIKQNLGNFSIKK